MALEPINAYRDEWRQFEIVSDTGWKEAKHISGTNTYHENKTYFPADGGFYTLSFEIRLSELHGVNSNTLGLGYTLNITPSEMQLRLGWDLDNDLITSLGSTLRPSYVNDTLMISASTLASTSDITLISPIEKVAGALSDKFYFLDDHGIPIFPVMLPRECTPVTGFWFDFYTSQGATPDSYFQYRIRVIKVDRDALEVVK